MWNKYYASNDIKLCHVLCCFLYIPNVEYKLCVIYNKIVSYFVLLSLCPECGIKIMCHVMERSGQHCRDI